MLNPAEAIYRIASKVKDLPNKVPHFKIDELIKTANVYRKKMTDFKNILGSGITLTNNEIKNIMKVIKSLEKIVTTGLPLMKNITSSYKCFDFIRIDSSSISNRCSCSNENFGSGTTTFIISNEED